MPATFDLELRFFLPPSLPPDLVVRNLHRYEPLIRPNPYLQGFERRAVDLEEVIADPFFTEDGTNITGFEIHDRIPIVASLGLTKDVKFPALFQSFAGGVRVRADAAAGTRVRSVYEVCPREASAGDSQQERGVAGWDLVERSHVECNALLRPFIVKSFEAAHRDLCGRVIKFILDSTQKELPPLPRDA